MKNTRTTSELDFKEMVTPAKLAKDMVRLKQLKDAIDKQYKDTREQLLEVTKSLGVKTLKTEDYTLSRVSKKTLRVIDDERVEEHLKSLDIPVDMVRTLAPHMKDTVKKLAEQQEVPGTELLDSEYVTVRVNK